MDNKILDHDHYIIATLKPTQLNQIKSLEQNLQSTSNKNIVLIAYEPSTHNPT